MINNEATKHIKAAAKLAIDAGYSSDIVDACALAVRALEREPKTGIWKEDIDNNRRWDRVRFYCSECGDWQTYGKPKFCPNCGCRMESEAKE